MGGLSRGRLFSLLCDLGLGTTPWGVLAVQIKWLLFRGGLIVSRRVFVVRLIGQREDCRAYRHASWRI
jgi:hypothetical protein